MPKGTVKEVDNKCDMVTQDYRTLTNSLAITTGILGTDCIPFPDDEFSSDIEM